MSLHNKDLQKLQAMMMIQMKVRGMGNKEIAEELNIHPDTVERRLAYANKAGLFIELERQFLQELVPAGMKALKTAMEDGDAETALELFKCLGVLKDPKAPKTTEQINDDNELQKAISEARTVAQIAEGVIDGTVVTGRKSLAGLVEDPTEQAGEAPIDATSPSVESGTNAKSAP
jgi:uncharacterized membrane protein